MDILGITKIKGVKYNLGGTQLDKVKVDQKAQKIFINYLSNKFFQQNELKS